MTLMGNNPRMTFVPKKSLRIMTLAFFLAMTTLVVLPSFSHALVVVRSRSKSHTFHNNIYSAKSTWSSTLLPTSSSSPFASTTARSSSVAPLQYIHREEEANTNDISQQDISTISYNNKNDPQQQQQHDDDYSKEEEHHGSDSSSVGGGLPIVYAIATSQIITMLVTTLIACGILYWNDTNFMDPMTWHWNFNYLDTTRRTISEYHHSLFDFRSSTASPFVVQQQLLQGILATIPMIYLGSKIEQSDQRDESHVNFSTMNMVMTLFGRRTPGSTTKRQVVVPTVAKDETTTTHTIPTSTQNSYTITNGMMEVLPVAAGIALMTGISEEVVFRGEIPTVMTQLLSSSIAPNDGGSTATATALFIFLTVWIGQATLFGLGHVSHKASFGENRIVSGLQFMNGLWYGFIYAVTGGNILPCMIAHTLYDCHVFMETWMSMNDQMDYTEDCCCTPLSILDQDGLEQIQKEAGPLFTDSTISYVRHFFYTFDSEHVGSLSRSDVQRAITYAFLDDPRVNGSSNNDGDDDTHTIIQPPTPQRINKLFDGMLKRRAKQQEQVGQENVEAFPENRLRLCEFLRVLFVLKGNPQAT